MNRPKKIFIVLRPTTVEYINNIYSIKNRVLNPTKKTIDKLISYLNDNRKIKYLIKKYKHTSLKSRANCINRRRAELITKHYGCNILGGVFLELLNSYNLIPKRVIGQMNITTDDKKFFVSLFPRLIKYLNDDGNKSIREKHYIKGIINDITGHYQIIELATDMTLKDTLTLLIFLKNFYRRATRKTIPIFAVGVKFNLVHSADTKLELGRNKKLFRSRYQS